MSKREVRIGFQHGLETGGRIGSEGEVAGDEMVEGSGSLGADVETGSPRVSRCMALFLADISHKAAVRARAA